MDGQDDGPGAFCRQHPYRGVFGPITVSIPLEEGTHIIRVETTPNAAGNTGFDELAVTLEKREVPVDLEGQEPPPPPPAPPAPDIRGWWHFDETFPGPGQPPSTMTPDASGNGNHATLMNGATLVPGGVSGSALCLWGAPDGWADGWLEIPASESLVLASSDFTIELSMKRGIGSYDYLLAMPGVILFVDEYGRVQCNISGPPIPPWYNEMWLSNQVLAPGEWNHLALVRSGENVTLYMNGLPDSGVQFSASLYPYANWACVGPIWQYFGTEPVVVDELLIAATAALPPAGEPEAPSGIYASLYIPESLTAGACDVVRYFHGLRDAGPTDPAFAEAEGEPASLVFRGAFQGVETTIALDPATFPGLTENVDSFVATMTYAFEDGAIVAVPATFTETEAGSCVFRASLFAAGDPPSGSGAPAKWVGRVENGMGSAEGLSTPHCIRVHGVTRGEDFSVSVLDWEFGVVERDGLWYLGKDATTFAHIVLYKDQENPNMTWVLVDPEPPQVLKGQLPGAVLPAKGKHRPANAFVAELNANRTPEADLDVDADGTVGSNEGTANYLPGYAPLEAGPPLILVPVLSEGTTFNTAAYTPQKMKLILPLGRAKVDKITFGILYSDATCYPGYCGNATDERIGLDELDFSFNADTEKYLIEITSETPAPNENTAKEGGHIDEDKTWVFLWCKDYGAYCRLVIYPEKAGKPLARSTLTVPFDTGNRIGDLWVQGMAQEWMTQYGQARASGTFAVLEDSEPEDPDGSGPCVAQASKGDGITVCEEYRGFILDGGGFDGNGQNGHPGGHRRLCPARKEILLEVDRHERLAVPGSTGTVVDNACKIFSSAAPTFWNPAKSRGCGILVYYVWDQALNFSEGQIATKYLQAVYLRDTRTNDLLTRHFVHVIISDVRPASSPYGVTYEAEENRRARGCYVFVGDEQYPVDTRSIVLAHEIMHTVIRPRPGWHFTAGEHVINPDQDDVRYWPYTSEWQQFDHQLRDWLPVPPHMGDQDDVSALMHAHQGMGFWELFYRLDRVYVSEKTQRVIDLKRNSGLIR